MGAWWISLGSPSGPRSFDPFRIADLEYRMWVGYYLRRWTHVAAALVQLLRLGFGADLARAAQGAFLMLRAVQLWAPFPDNDPDGAQACMRELYALVRLRYGAPADPARAAALEVDWWRAHRERQYSADPSDTGEEVVESVTRLYCYLLARPPMRSGRPPCTGCRPWTCPTSGSGKAASPAARCSRWNAPRWSAPTPPCWPASTARNHDERQAMLARARRRGSPR